MRRRHPPKQPTRAANPQTDFGIPCSHHPPDNGLASPNMFDDSTNTDYQAYFADAASAVQSVLAAARQRVVCALARDCSRHWFELLLQVARRGVALRLLVPDTTANRQSAIAWERISAAGGELHWLDSSAPILQTTVCVVDGHTVLSGAIAELSTVVREDFAGVVRQSDLGLAARCLQGLDAMVPPGAALPEAETIAQTASSQALVLSADLQARTAAWQSELLQCHSLALQAELDEMQRSMQSFDRQQDAAIGDLLREFLDLKRQYLAQMHARFGGAEREAQSREADESFSRYTESHPDDERQDVPPELDLQAQQELKRLYRKLAMQCHPDRVDSAQDKQHAQALFQRLQRSYQASDMRGLQKLQAQLELGQDASSARAPGAASATRRAPAQWAMELSALQSTLAQQQAQRLEILQSATWRTLVSQSRWDLWFAQQAKHLQTEVARYREALQETASQNPAQIQQG